MTYKEFEREISAGRFRSYYIFSGPEEVKKKQALDLLRSACLPAGLEILNETVLENCSVSDIIDNAILLPVMCDRRILIVRDWAPFVAAKKESEAADDDKKKSNPNTVNREKMLEWLKQAPDSCVIVFLCVKELTKSLAKDPGLVQFNYLTGNELREECSAILAPFGKQIADKAFDELTLMVGTDLTRLTAELTKLASYTGKSRSIGVDDVHNAVTPSPEYTVFSILDHLLDNNIAEATRVLNSLLKQPSVVPVYIIAMFSSSLRVYYMMKVASESGSIDETVKHLKVSDGRRRYIQNRFRSVSAEDLKVRYELCIRADTEIKSGRANDRAALDLLMQKLLLPKKQSERSRVRR